MGTITLYEGNGASQNVLATYGDEPFESSVQPNDEARSAKLNNVKAGCKITVYDSKTRPESDDYTTIEVLKEVPEIIISSFEQNYRNENVHVIYHRKNGLDGKVSYIKVE